MKKVGVVTYQDIADGKGRFLQAYALYSAIADLGYNPEIIDYYPIINGIKSSLSKKLLRALKNPKILAGYMAKLQYNILHLAFRKGFSEKRKLYEGYIKKHIKVTEKRYYGSQSLQELGSGYDAYVCGSDQIWNPYFQGMDAAYYLNFAPKEKRIAYAPSLGTVQIDDDKKEYLKSNIQEIPYISVREESGSKLASELIGREVRNVLDPTFLMPQQWWNDFAGDYNPKKPYVLTFFFDNSRYPRNIAKKIAKKYGCDIISIPDSFADIFFSGSKEVSIGPERFVNLFKNASFICTQSFHGTVLSIIYNRPFYVFNRQTKAYVSGVFSRIEDLLNKVKLTDRILKPGQALSEDFDKVYFNNANKIVGMERDKSLQFLRNALQKATGGE